MAMDLNAALTITTKVDGANKIVDLQRGLAGVESTAKTVTGALNGMAGASQGLFSALGALTPLLSVAGLVGMAKGALDAGQEMLHMSEKTGLSVEQLAKFKKAAALANVDLETVGKSVVKFDKSMVDAFANGKSAKFFDVLGISVKDSSGHLKDNNEVLLQVADKFKAMPDGAAKTAIAIGLLGKAGADAIPFLNQGGKAIDGMAVSMNTKFAEAADKYKQQLSALNGQVSKLGMDLAQALLPALAGVTQAVITAVKWFNGLPEPLKQSIEAIAGLSIAWATFASLVSVLPALTTAFEAFWAALTGPVGIAIAALVLVAETAYNLSPPFRAFVDEFPQRFAAFFKDMSALASDAFVNIADNLATLGKFISDLWKVETELIAYEWHAMIYLMGGDNGWFISSVKNVASSIASVFGGLMTWVSQHWKQMIAGMIDALIPVASAVKIFSGGKADLGMAAANGMATVGGIAYKDFTTPIAGQKQKATNSAASFNPDLPGGAAKLGKLDTAAIDQEIQLNAELKKIAILFQQDAIQKQINADSLLESQYAHDHNDLGVEQMRIAVAQLNFQKEAVQIEADYQSKLQENNKQKTEHLHALADEVAFKDRTRKLDEAQTKAVEARKKAEQDYNNLLTDEAKKQRQALEDIANRNKYTIIGATQGKDVEALTQEWDKLNRQVQDHTLSVEYANQQYDKLKKSYAEMQNLGNNATYGIAKGTQDYISGIGTLADSIAGATKGAFSQLETELTSFFETGKLNFKAFADYAIKELMRIVLEQTLLKPLAQGIGGLFGGGGGFLGGLFGGGAAASSGLGNAAFSAGFNVPSFSFANGGIMSASGSMPLHSYAGGGIANSPQLALFGEGSMNEAYVPLPDGRRIPVAMNGGGGGGTTVNVSVDAKGSSVQGNGGQSAALGRAIAASVQAELIKQKRPGGLLAA